MKNGLQTVGLRGVGNVAVIANQIGGANQYGVGLREEGRRGSSYTPRSTASSRPFAQGACNWAGPFELN